MTRSRFRTAAAVLLAAVLAAWPLSAAASPALDAQRAALLSQRDPNAADRFLDDQGLQASLKAEDAKAELELFRAAAELRDLKELLRGYQQEKRVIRDGLAARPDCAFCQDPGKLLDWADRWKAAPRPFLREALFEWDTLTPARVQWLAAHRSGRAEWEAMSFAARQAKLREWGTEILATLMKTSPKNQAELDALGARADDINDVIGHDDAYALGQRVEKAEAAVNAMKEAEARAAKSGDPKLAAALRAAQNAPDLESRLAELGKLFDGLGEKNAALHAAAPAKPGQGFDDRTRKLAAEILGPALLRETEGTWAGDELKAFYAKVPLKITIKPEAVGNLATYSDGVMNFGAGDIEDFLKGRGRSARDLLTDSALLRDLTRELAPTFVHEATHHRQDVWARSQGLPDSWSQYEEIEAMQTESIYILEKARRDPSYKAFLEKNAETDVNAREATGLSQRLETGGADQFRRSIRALHYPGLVSLEGEIWSRIVARNKTEVDVRAELRRRESLSPPRRLLLMAGPDIGAEYDTHEEFLTALRGAGTGSLTRLLAENVRKNATEPDVYARHRARFDGVNKLTEERLRTLAADPDPAKARRTVVPSPGGPR